MYAGELQQGLQGFLPRIEGGYHEQEKPHHVRTPQGRNCQRTRCV